MATVTETHYEAYRLTLSRSEKQLLKSTALILNTTPRQLIEHYLDTLLLNLQQNCKPGGALLGHTLSPTVR